MSTRRLPRIAVSTVRSFIVSRLANTPIDGVPMYNMQTLMHIPSV